MPADRDNAGGSISDIGSFGNFFYPVGAGSHGRGDLLGPVDKVVERFSRRMQYIIRPGGGVLNSAAACGQTRGVIALRSTISF